MVNHRSKDFKKILSTFRCLLISSSHNVVTNKKMLSNAYEAVGALKYSAKCLEKGMDFKNC